MQCRIWEAARRHREASDQRARREKALRPSANTFSEYVGSLDMDGGLLRSHSWPRRGRQVHLLRALSCEEDGNTVAPQSTTLAKIRINEMLL